MKTERQALWTLIAVVAIATGSGLYGLRAADGPPSYAYAGTGFEQMNATYPQPSESGYNWSLSLRYVKQAALSFADTAHYRSGAIKSNYLQGYMLAADQVSETNLTPAVRSKLNAIGTNSTSELLITNALTFYTSVETTAAEASTATNDTLLGSTTLSSNTFSKVMVTAEIYLVNNTGSPRTWTAVKIKAGGAVKKDFPALKVKDNLQALYPVSTIFAGGNTNDLTIEVTAASDNNTTDTRINARLLNLRVWGLP
jgi:hypothetical protein